MLHDLTLVIAAMYAIDYTPPTIAESLGSLDIVWVVMLLSGAVAGLVGSLTRKAAIEVPACVLMASGMITWAVAAITRVNTTPTTATISAALAAGGLAVMWRMFGVLVGVYLRARD